MRDREPGAEPPVAQEADNSEEMAPLKPSHDVEADTDNAALSIVTSGAAQEQVTVKGEDVAERAQEALRELPLAASSDKTLKLPLPKTSRRRSRQKDLQTFALFLFLPAELRHMIWHFLLPGPRIHTLTLSVLGAWKVARIPTNSFLTSCGNQLAVVCHESRQIFRAYKARYSIPFLRQDCIYINGNTHFLDAVDTLSLGVGAAPFFWHNFVYREFEGLLPRANTYDGRLSPSRLTLRGELSIPWFKHQITAFKTTSATSYGQTQYLLDLSRLKVIYLLDKRIRRSTTDVFTGPSKGPSGRMAWNTRKMCTKEFLDHMGAKFVGIDPFNKGMLKYWTIPEGAWDQLQDLKDELTKPRQSRENDALRCIPIRFLVPV